MLNVDFTSRLGATVTGVNRNEVVKFNNSWLHLATHGNDEDYLVVYRAMVHHPFAAPPPVLPGQAGTPWAAGWAGPVGNTAIEGTVPAGRTGRYFDGVGVAEIRLTFNAGQITNLQVIADTILENSDGFEDPRIFRYDGRFFIHSHRFHPDLARGAPAPMHDVYQGYAPARRPVQPANMGALFVKVNELTFDAVGPKLQPGFFYGSNVSNNFEKNYGFFERGGALYAVYGVAPSDRPLTILRGASGLLGAEFAAPLPYTQAVFAEEFQPSPPAQELFLQVQRHYAAQTPGAGPVVFSSSGPMLSGGGPWFGVGHVKIFHARVDTYLTQLGLAMLHAIQNDGPSAGAAGGANSGPTALARFIADAGFRAAVLNYAQGNPGALAPFVTATVGAVPGPADTAKFIAGIQHNFPDSHLARMVRWAYGLAQGHVSYWAGNLCPNPRLLPAGGPDTRIIFHPHTFYLSFFYALDAANLNLVAASNAFLIYDNTTPRMLQFASNPAQAAAGGWIVGFGEDDNRAKFFHFTQAEINNAMAHNPAAFNPANFQFLWVQQNEVVL